MRRIRKFFTFICLSAAFMLAADNQAASESFAKAREKENQKKHLSAADDYMEAEVQADDPVMKANALSSAARCYRKEKYYGKEFDCLQRLVKGHFNRVPVAEIVQRQYEIGDEFRKGHCDRFVSWIPFILRDSRTAEIYEAALENGPCSPKAPETRLALARIYIEDQKYQEAMKHLSAIIKLNPASKEARFAALELANVLMHCAERGDGDGKYAKEALDAFQAFIEKHPKDPEIDWVIRSREKVRTILARRNRMLGDYYRDHGKPEVAQRYYAIVIRDYANTEEAPVAEKKLADIDSSFKKSGKKWTPAQRKFKFQSFPKEESPIMVLPSESKNRWLLPIRDLKKGEVKTVQPKIEEISDDAY